MTGSWITDATVALARELWDEGVSGTDIGKRFGVTKSAVVGLAHRRGWPRRPSPIPIDGVFETGTLVRKPKYPKRQSVAPLPSLEVPPEPEPAPEAPVVPLWVSLPVSPAKACQWPGSPWRRPWPLCGAACVGHGPYCEQHRAVAWVGTTRRAAA